MAETKPAANKPFHHDGRPVFVLIPQNTGYNKVCQDVLADMTSKMEAPPEVCSEIRVKQLPPDVVVYVMHPVKTKQKDTRNKLRSTMTTHLSAPIDLFKVASDSNKKGYRTLNNSLVVQAINAACNNDPAGLFFRGTLTSESQKDPDGLLLKISEQ